MIFTLTQNAQVILKKYLITVVISMISTVGTVGRDPQMLPSLLNECYVLETVTLSGNNSGKLRERLIFKVFELMHSNFTF